MSKPFVPFRCVECGDYVKLVTGPGRVEPYRRGLSLPVPDDFEIPTCPTCGETYFTVERGAELADLQAPLYRDWQSRHVRGLVESLKQQHRVTQRQIEGLCGVTKTYLSHVLAGRKEASSTLLNLLEAYARTPEEFARKMRGDPWDATYVLAGAATTPAYAPAKSTPSKDPGVTVDLAALLQGLSARSAYAQQTTWNVAPANDTEAA